MDWWRESRLKFISCRLDDGLSCGGVRLCIWRACTAGGVPHRGSSAAKQRAGSRYKAHGGATEETPHHIPSLSWAAIILALHSSALNQRCLEKPAACKSGCLPIIILQQSAQPLAARNLPHLPAGFGTGLKDLVVQPLMRPFAVIMDQELLHRLAQRFLPKKEHTRQGFLF